MHNIQRFSSYRLSFSHQTKGTPIITVVSVVTIYIYLCIIYVYVFRLGSKLVYSEFFLDICFYQLSGTVQIGLLLV